MALRSRNMPEIWRGGGPYRELNRLQRNLERAFDDMLSPYAGEAESFLTAFVPPVDFDETDSQYIVNLDLPGVDLNDVHIEIRDNQLVVSGERKHEERKEQGTRVAWERVHGTFQRVFLLPSSVDSNRIAANLENGVLSITIPKVESSHARQITIQGSGQRRQQIQGAAQHKGKPDKAA